MGKRSRLGRTPHDFYETPFEAVRPLLRVLPRGLTFVEPCAGGGAIVRALEETGRICIGQFDRERDARHALYPMAAGDMFVTNPPYWGRPAELHPLIENLSDQAPTWLLLPSDWLFNASSGPLTMRLRRIVAVGRVKWFPLSSSSSMDNAAWLLFDRPKRTAGFFVGRQCKIRRRGRKVMAANGARDSAPPTGV
jgi:hypothetical protein